MECLHCQGWLQQNLLPVAHGDLQQHSWRELEFCKPMENHAHPAFSPQLGTRDKGHVLTLST